MFSSGTLNGDCERVNFPCHGLLQSEAKDGWSGARTGQTKTGRRERLGPKIADLAELSAVRLKVETSSFGVEGDYKFG
jgi:hypothetical protein